MNIRTHRTTLTLSLSLLGLLTAAALAAPGPFEEPKELKAADLLPATIVSGAHSTVLDPVQSDGYLYIYRLQTKNGELNVVSRGTLYQRVHEFDMMAQIDKLSGTKEFSKGVKAQAENVVDGVVDLVTDPSTPPKKPCPA